MHQLAIVTQTSSGAGVFLTWGAFSIQLGNLIVILAMLTVFVCALFIPFPGGRRKK